MTSRPLTTAALLVAVFLAAMELTVVATVMPTIAAELGGIALYRWAFAAYLIAATVTLPIWGKLADVFGRKRVLLAGVAVFLSGALACGLSRSMEQLVAARVLAGLGAGVLPVAYAILGDLFDVHELGRLQVALSAVSGVAGLAGPLVGGAIAQTIGWRWVFWLELPLGAGGALLLVVAYHETIERKERALDLAGAALLAIAVVATLVASRSRGTALLAVPVALAATAALVLVERRAREPILPLDLLGRRVMAISSATQALAGSVMQAAVVFVPLWAQSVLGLPPASAGAVLVPSAVAWPIAGAVSGRAVARLGYRPLLFAGLAQLAAGAALLALCATPAASVASIQLAMALLGAGFGTVGPPLLYALQASVPWDRRGVATASTLFFRTIGGALAVGVLGGTVAGALELHADASLVELLLGPERAGLEPATVTALAAPVQDALSIVFRTCALAALAALAVVSAFPRLAIERRAPGGAGPA